MGFFCMVWKRVALFLLTAQPTIIAEKNPAASVYREHTPSILPFLIILVLSGMEGHCVLLLCLPAFCHTVSVRYGAHCLALAVEDGTE